MDKIDKLPINPGTILLCPASKVEGGKKRITRKRGERSLNSGAGEATDFDVTIEVQDAEERRKAENLVLRGTQIIRQHATLTSIGYLSAPEELTEVVKKFSALKLSAENFNATSTFSKVVVSFLPIEIGGTLSTNEECAKALADHVRSELESLRDALTSGNVVKVTNILLGCRRMHTLSVGTQADAIKFAIEESVAQKTVLKRRIHDGETSESAGRALKMPMVDSAIETFTYEPDKHAPELPEGSLDDSEPSAGVQQPPLLTVVAA